ncbi:MAG: PTS IIA-like nitrogen-regulatory protein PtsN [Rhodospirillaceae bacterium]|nr:PTS IIA-like nitrogen-regulatory protein PtsN [Rhodospirillaceae bacterium]
MEIENILNQRSVMTSLQASSKKHILQELACQASCATGLDERAVLDVLLERERLGTTGVGSGIAIPHGKLPGLDKLYGCFVRLETPIDFDSVDNEPVDLIFLLLAPESAGADHLKALARISRILRDVAHCKKLRTAAGSHKIYNLLTADIQSRAA